MMTTTLTKPLTGAVRRPLREEDRLLGTADLVALTGLSERTLRRYRHDPVDPLPCRRLGQRVLTRRGDFDAWYARRSVAINPTPTPAREGRPAADPPAAAPK